MLRYAEAPYAHGLLHYADLLTLHMPTDYCITPIYLRYASTQIAHVHLKKNLVTLRNDVIYVYVA